MIISESKTNWQLIRQCVSCHNVLSEYETKTNDGICCYCGNKNTNTRECETNNNVGRFVTIVVLNLKPPFLHLKNTIEIKGK